ncbi:MAG TPA: FAD binding domain-containing protein [Spirochaetia bacterium]|nr:FAD binding domain-containing protein [Spirochaetia bacterium]
MRVWKKAGPLSNPTGGHRHLVLGSAGAYNARIMITDIARPATVTEAVKAGSAPGAAYLGGGTWLNSGRARGVTTLVSLERLGLAAIHADSNRCTVGAAATFQAIVDNPAVPAGLRQAVLLTASRTLRNMVTLGGELGLRPRDSAVIPLLLAVQAEVTLAGRRKPVPVQAIVDEDKAGLILSISVPLRPASAVRALSRTSHAPRFLVIARCADRLVASDCQGRAVVLRDPAAFQPRADIYASAEYKRYMVGVLAEELAAAAGAAAQEPSR